MSADDQSRQKLAGDVEMGGMTPKTSPFRVSLKDLQELNEDVEVAIRRDRVEALGGVEEICNKLNSSSSQGIQVDKSGKDLDARANAFGVNSMPTPPAKSFFVLYLESFNDPMLIVLIICAFVSLVVEMINHPETGWIDGVAILIAVNIVSVVTAVNDYTKEKQFRKLNEVKDKISINVIRGGETVYMSVHDIMVGDVVQLETGNKIPADGLLIQGDKIKCDESALTGEPEEMGKSHEKDPFFLSGCSVTAGIGTMLVIAVGPESRWGRIKSKLGDKDGDTPLQEKLNDMVKLIGYIGTAAALATFTAQFIIWWVECPSPCSSSETMCPDRTCVTARSMCPQCPGTANTTLNYACWDPALQKVAGTYCRTNLDDCLFKVPDEVVPCRPANKNVATYFISAFIIAVTVVVVAIPEGLPLAVTIALSYSTKQMLKDNNLIRKLAACETMGNATTICSDKTGTLTKNQMTIVEGWFAGTVYEMQGGVKNVPTHSDLSQPALDALRSGFCLNSTATIHFEQTDSSPEGLEKINGSKTEGAMLLMARDSLNANYSDLRKAAKPCETQIYLFEAKRKMMSVLYDMRSFPDEAAAFDGHRLYTKGASEYVVKNCTRYVNSEGNVVDLDDEMREKLSQQIGAMADKALRTLGVAFRDFGPGELPEDLDTPPETGMTLAAIVGIMDPLRDEVKDAVRRCIKAGITVRMVTGDNIRTARAIAKNCGIYDEARGDVVMEGPAFRKMSPAELDKVLENLTVLARSAPEDKHTLVTRLNGRALPRDQAAWEKEHKGRSWEERDAVLPGYFEEWTAKYKRGQVVGVTGDGTNDAPALKTADVGLSMGKAGTEVAKEASDIIIMDDNFQSIVQAVKWGRCIYDNIRKFLQFQLTVNVVALTITFIGAVTGFEPPLNAVMMLWVNLIMDTLGALALATEPPRDDLLDRLPYKRDASLVGHTMWRNIFAQSIFQLILLLVLLYTGQSLFDLDRSGRENCKVYESDLETCKEHDYTHYTIIFNTFVFCQIFNQFNARQLHSNPNVWTGLLGNPIFLAILLAEALMQVFMVYVAGPFMHTTGLTAGQFFASVGLAAITMPLGIVMRYIPPTTEQDDQFMDAPHQLTALRKLEDEGAH